MASLGTVQDHQAIKTASRLEPALSRDLPHPGRGGSPGQRAVIEGLGVPFWRYESRAPECPCNFPRALRERADSRPGSLPPSRTYFSNNPLLVEPQCLPLRTSRVKKTQNAALGRPSRSEGPIPPLCPTSGEPRPPSLTQFSRHRSPVPPSQGATLCATPWLSVSQPSPPGPVMAPPCSWSSVFRPPLPSPATSLGTSPTLLLQRNTCTVNLTF